jgi:hypothetical protein
VARPEGRIVGVGHGSSPPRVKVRGVGKRPTSLIFLKADLAGCGRNIGRPVARSGRGCDSSFVRDGRRANPRHQCRAPLGPMARLGSLRYPCPILGVRSCSVDRDTPQTIDCTRGRGGGEERSPRGRPQSPGGLRCPGALDRDPASPPSRRSDRRSRSSHQVCETGPAWRTPSLLASL